MCSEAKDAKLAGKTEALKTLAIMLDYAIIEGAQLRLPVFVFMLRAARLELINSLEVQEATLPPSADMQSQKTLN
ncbi:MAG: hypothetical protein ACRECO_03905 [Xanthobacteraceae bacterium]